MSLQVKYVAKALLSMLSSGCTRLGTCRMLDWRRSRNRRKQGGLAVFQGLLSLFMNEPGIILFDTIVVCAHVTSSQVCLL